MSAIYRRCRALFMAGAIALVFGLLLILPTHAFGPSTPQLLTSTTRTNQPANQPTNQLTNQLTNQPTNPPAPHLSSPIPGPALAAPTPTFAERVVMLTNQQRNQAGLPPLKHEPLLRQTAEGHSQRMAVGNFFMHCDPDTGKLPWDRMRDVGYNWTMAGENIAVGYQTPDAVMNAWMSSPPHAAAILSPDFLEIGVGYYYQADDQPNLRYSTTNSCTPNTTVPGPYYHYWTQDFGRRWNVWPLIIAGEAFTTPSLRVELYLYRPTSPSQMRLSNDGIQWSDWRPFTETLRWQLNPGNGEKVVHAQVYNGASTYSVSDTIHLDAPPPVTAAVEISAAANVTLTWQHAAVNLWYDVYGSNRPYFTPGDPDAVLLGPAVEPANGETKVIFTDTTGAANEVRFYVVRAVAGDGETTADSNRTGRFPFPLLPGD